MTAKCQDQQVNDLDGAGVTVLTPIARQTRLTMVLPRISLSEEDVKVNR
jgi:hypothetical protein